MNIDFDTLARLIDLTSRSPIQSLTIEDGNQTITLVNPIAQTDHLAPISPPSPPLVSSQMPQQSLQESSIPSDHTIVSPMLGTFYRKPSQEAPAFVQVGDSIKSGDTLCIVEAMKMMHEVKADKDGVITKIFADDGDMVEYDTPLFTIQ